MEPSTSDTDDKYLNLAVQIDGRYSGNKITPWRRNDEKSFEAALEIVGYSRDDIPQVAKLLNKTVEEVTYYYDALLYDIQLIESGQVKPPDYPEYRSSPSSTSGILVNEKKRGRVWSEEEHRAFLEGLKERGKGDWKNISRDYVKTRTPTQVASHAQKFYKRQAEQTDDTTNKKKKRSSIHDITSVGTDSVTIPPRSEPQNHTIPPPPRSELDSVSQPHNQTIPPRFGLDTVSQPQNHTTPPRSDLDSLSQPQNHIIAPRSDLDSVRQPHNHTIAPRSDLDSLSQPHNQLMLPQQYYYYDDSALFFEGLLTDLDDDDYI